MTRPTDKEFEDHFKPPPEPEDPEYVLLYREAERARSSEAHLLNALQRLIPLLPSDQFSELGRAAIALRSTVAETLGPDFAA